MVRFTKENVNEVRLMAKVHTSMRVEDMWVCGRRTFNMGKVCKYGMMVPNTMEILRMTINKEEEHKPLQMGKQISLFC